MLGGGGVGIGVTGAGCCAPGGSARGPMDTGGGALGSVWTVTVVGGGTGPTGGVAIFGVGVFVAQPATSESRTALATKPLTLLWRRIAHAGWQTAHQVRWNRPPARNDRRGDGGRLTRNNERRLARHERGRLTGVLDRRLHRLRRHGHR